MAERTETAPRRRRRSWKAIADRLAERLSHHAYRDCEHEELKPDECAFCADVAAYWEYLEAGGTDWRGR